MIVILSGKEIYRNLNKKIFIEPFNERQLNPNSYNLRLHNQLLVYEDPVLDMKKPNKTSVLTIPESGLVLEPNRLYLGRTVEYTRTEGFVPMLEGRSSVGRLGLVVHVTAALATWVSLDTGLWRCSALNQSVYAGVGSVRFTTILSAATTSLIQAENIRTTMESSPAYIAILKNSNGCRTAAISCVYSVYSAQHHP